MGSCRRGTRTGQGTPLRPPARCLPPSPDAARDLRSQDPRRQRGHPGGPRGDPCARGTARRVGRGRGRPGHGELGRPRVLHPQGRAQRPPVRLVPRRAGPIGVPAAGRPPDRRPRPDRPVRAAGRAPALRRIDPAGGLRRPDAPLRGAEGAAHPGGAVRHGPQATAPAAPDDDRRDHQPDRRRLARHRPCPRPPLAADPGRPRRVPGPGRGGAGQHRRRVPPARALDRAEQARRPARRRPAGDDPRPRRRQPRGPLVVQRRARRAGGRRPHGPGRLRRRPRGRRHAGRLRRGRPRADAVRRRGARRPGPGASGRRPSVGRASGSRQRPPPTSARGGATSRRSGAPSTGSTRSPSSRRRANGSGCCSIEACGRSTGRSGGAG